MIRWCRSQCFEFGVPASAIFIPQFPTSLPGLHSDLARAQELLRLTGKANEVLKPSNVATKSREVPNQRIQKPCETEGSNENDVIGVWFYFDYRYWESPGNDSLHHEVIVGRSRAKKAANIGSIWHLVSFLYLCFCESKPNGGCRTKLIKPLHCSLFQRNQSRFAASSHRRQRMPALYQNWWMYWPVPCGCSVVPDLNTSCHKKVLIDMI